MFEWPSYDDLFGDRQRRVKTFRRVALVVAVVAVAGALLAAGLSRARAHTAPSGWAYDTECCSTRDCAPAAPGTVNEVRGGYEIVLRPGSHPSARSVVVRDFVPHGDPRIRPSGDEYRHVCVIPGSQRVLCLYVPPGGV